MFNPGKEDSASGFRIEPPRPTPVTESSEDSQRAYPTRLFHSGPLVNQNHPSTGGGVKNGELKVPGAANQPVAVSTRSGLRTDGSSRTMVVQAEAFAHGRRLSESINEHFSNSGKYDQVFPKKDDRSSRADGAIVSKIPYLNEKGSILFQPWLLHCYLNCILACIVELKMLRNKPRF